MKRFMLFILCAALLCVLPLTVYAADDEGVLITVVIPQTPQPIAAPSPEQPEITVFPVAVYENSEGNRREIIRVYELWEHENVTQIPRNSFVREGFYYELAEITRQTLPGFSTRLYSETVTVNTQTNDLATVMQLLSPTLEFATEDGYFGILTLDISTIHMEQAGTRTTNSTVTTIREFPHLSAPDTSLVPRTVTDRNRTYELTDVEWRQQSSTNIDYRDVPASFTAVATYARTATSTVVTGYVTTAEYLGTVSRISTEVTRYTVYFLGVPIISPVISQPASDTGVTETDKDICEPVGHDNTDGVPVVNGTSDTDADTADGDNDVNGVNGVNGTNGEEYPYAGSDADANGYESDNGADEEPETTERRQYAPFIAVIILLSLIIAGLIGFINKARIAGFISRAKAGKAVALVLVVLMAAQLSISNVYAAPPPYRFGGGQSAVHINENRHNINARDRPGDFIITTPSIYQYGDFLGILHVERLNRAVRVYAGATTEAMDNGAGHFSFTGLNTGNTGLVGHNRGTRNGFFSFVRLLQEGDIITLDAGGITRTYTVSLLYTINENDFSPLMAFGDNRLTLVTCVEYQPGLRRVAVATETH
jgi:LPXTG-site transpeptidase (sortase) family protein